MGELTPGTQLSMGSAKRLYVLMAGFYMQWAFKTSAVKSRHKIFAFRSPLSSRLLPPGTSRFIFVPLNCAWVTFSLKCQCVGPRIYKLHHTCSEPKDSHQTATGSLRSMSNFTFPWPSLSLGDSSPLLVHEKICEIRLEKKEIQANISRGTETCGGCQMNCIILEIVVNLNLKLTSLVVLSGF